MKRNYNFCLCFSFHLHFLMPVLAVLFGSCASAQIPKQPKFITLCPTRSDAFTQARSINNKGQIVGISVTGSKLAPRSTGFLLTQGKYTKVQPPPGIGSTMDDLRLNDRGQIVGCYLLANNQPHSFLLYQGHYSEIIFQHSEYTRVFGINNIGDVAGIYGDQTNRVHGFLLKHGTFTPIDFPNANVVNVFGINDKDKIVGEYTDKSGHLHGFLWNNGACKIIDSPSGGSTIPLDINNKDQIVGMYFRPHHSVGVGFLWKNGLFTKIVPPKVGINLTAIGINDKGQIVGGYQDKNNLWHGFLRNP